ncbi:MAG TPA: C25 family cysteine peptidase, partial [Blastocatellia bacterium]|nr:C25 family cysteine peptidase [Blastocatellia bacterium]
MRRLASARIAIYKPMRLLWVIPIVFIGFVAQNTGSADDPSPQRGRRPSDPVATESGSPSPPVPASLPAESAAESGGRMVVPQASTGSASLLTVQGSNAGSSNGDYVSDSNELDTFYRFYIEVPSSLTRLTVEIFDPDIGLGGSSEDDNGRDRDRDGYNSTVTYTLLDPTGSTRATLNGNSSSPSGSDNQWRTLFNSTASIFSGHWELRVNMSSSVTSGNDINAIGIRAHDSTSGAGGTELNIYADSIVPVGVNPPGSGTNSRSYNLYPYTTSGCSCYKNDFDFDSNNGNTGSATFTSRSGAYTRSFTSSAMSGNDDWRRDNFSGWTTDSTAVDYGIWTAAVTINSYIVSGQQNGNYGNIYVTNSQSTTETPAANPVANSFRIYLPTDAGAAPVKPYVEQLLTFASVGPNPPAVGQASRFTVTVRVVNPTSRAITFSNAPANRVTANIPGSGATYAGNDLVSQGSVVSEPAVGGTGNIIWNPGTVAAGATAVLSYKVDVTPTSSGQRIPVTGTVASGNGTRAQFVDETGSTTQARATFLFGPLCELAVTQGILTAVDLARFNATRYDDGVLLQWETGFELDNLGFRLYREEFGSRVPVTGQIIPGSALAAGPGVTLGAGRSYQLWDQAKYRKSADAYWLEEIDLNGQSKWHGPFATSFAGGPPPRLASRAEPVAAQSLSVSEHGSPASAPLERAAALAPQSMQQMSAQAEVASRPALKLSIRNEGWYRVTQPEMVAAGFGAAVGAGSLQLYVDGQQVPIKVLTGKSGRFDSTAAIEFYAMGLDAAFSDTRVYWLVAGSEPGLRIGQGSGVATPSNARSFLHTVERKERTLFFFSLKNGEKENFFGATISPTPVEQSLTLQHPDASATSPATLEVALQGATLVPHRVRVELNGLGVGTLAFEDQSAGVARLSVSQGLVRGGPNQVKLTAEGGDSDYSFVDYIRISYWRSFTADDDALRVTVPGKLQTTIGGFTSGAIRVLDVTNPNSVQEVQGQIVQQKGAYSVKVSPPAAGQRTLLAVTQSTMKTPAAIWLNRPSTLRSPANGADVLMIAHKDFVAGCEPLKSHREREGLSVAIVNIEDVFDEFSYGQKSPQAIRDFLAFAATGWDRPPRFALLVGSASRDPKNYTGLGDLDFVPTKIVETTAMETASDQWFVEFGGDGSAEVQIGRLPARTPEELSGMVAKIIAYDAARSSSEVLLYADTNAGYDFRGASDELKSLLPSNITSEQINRDETDAATARLRLIAAIERGQKVVNYAGHGSATIWKDFVLTAADAENLDNGGRLPVFVMMTCLNGYFIDPGSASLAESLMSAPDGG